jgi:hypothetical protein
MFFVAAALFFVVLFRMKTSAYAEVGTINIPRGLYDMFPAVTTTSETPPPMM